MLAPNPHNLQSWLADIREPGRIVLSVDLQRLLPATDPSNRQILIGCGAFMELLSLAAREEGWQVAIELMPNGDYPASGVDGRPFASVRFERSASITADPLFANVRKRRTNRQPYAAEPPSAKAWLALAAAAQRPGISVSCAQDPAQVARIRDLAIRGYEVEFRNPATWEESANVVRLGTQAVEAEPSGVPALGSLVWLGRTFGVVDRESLRKADGYAAKRTLEESTKAAHHTPTWIWLVSADNSRRSQIEAGRAYMRLDLAAVGQRLAIHPNSQVLQEFSQMESLYKAFHAEVGVPEPGRVQMLARLGFADQGGPSPRRRVQRILRA
jgi:hypothetical protein